MQLIKLSAYLMKYFFRFFAGGRFVLWSCALWAHVFVNTPSLIGVMALIALQFSPRWQGEIAQQPAEEFCQSRNFEEPGEHSLVPPLRLGKTC